MIRILAIGDPHGSLDKIKKIPKKNIDLIILTGDLGKANLMRKMAFENVERRKKGLEEKEFTSQQKKRAFMEAYNSSMKVVRYLAKYAPVYTIYGNVEFRNSETKEASKEFGVALPFLTNDLKKIKGVRVINNVLAKFKGVRIGGLDYFIDVSWVKEFKPSEYKLSLQGAKEETDKANKVLSKFKDIDILVCHQPPYGILDKVGKMAPKHWRGKKAGSKAVLNYIKKKQPKYVFCGHIHEGEGREKIGKTEVYNLGVAGHKIVEL